MSSDSTENLDKNTLYTNYRPEFVAACIVDSGFEADEVENLLKKGAKAVSLGPRILRTETAGMAMCAEIVFELGE